MEGNDVCKIYIMVSIAADMLACGDPGPASFSHRLAFDASLEADRHHDRSLFPVHQGLIHTPRQGPRRLKTNHHQSLSY